MTEKQALEIVMTLAKKGAGDTIQTPEWRCGSIDEAFELVEMKIK